MMMIIEMMMMMIIIIIIMVMMIKIMMIKIIHDDFNLPALISSSFLNFAVNIVTDGCVDHLLPSHTSHGVLQASGVHVDSDDNLIHPLALPISISIYIYHQSYRDIDDIDNT
jgi:hypothetical protein